MKQTETNWSLSGLILKNFLVLLSTSEGVNFEKVKKWGENPFFTLYEIDTGHVPAPGHVSAVGNFFFISILQICWHPLGLISKM